MQWLSRGIGALLSAAGLDLSGRIGGSVQFFLYDTIKITILLCVLIFLVSYIQSYFPPERSPPHPGPVPGAGRQHRLRPFGHGDPLLLLLLHPFVHGLYGSGAAAGGDIFFPHLLPHGGPGQPGAADEHFRRTGGGDLRGHGPGDAVAAGHSSSACTWRTRWSPSSAPPCAPGRTPRPLPAASGSSGHDSRCWHTEKRLSLYSRRCGRGCPHPQLDPPGLGDEPLRP